MKILVLCYEYPPIGGGGGRVAQSIARAMAARGHEVRVQTAALGWRSSHEIADGVEIHRTASLRRVPDTCAVHEMGFYVATSFLPTLQHIRRWKPDVMHAHFAVPTGALAWAAHALTGVPYVLTAHLGDVPGGVPEQTDRLFRLIGPAAQRIWKSAAAVTAVSSFVQELAERACHRPVERILNGIELPPDRPETFAQPIRLERHLIFAGRFNPQKNVLFLAEALTRLSGTNWRATFIGDGPDRAAAERQIAKAGLRDRVRFTGWLGSVEVQAILADGDILCLPSLSEGLPVAAVEALAHGLAIVSSDIPGIRDVVEHAVNGLRLPLGDPAQYAARLDELLRDPAALLAMRQASWAKARTFQLSRIADHYERVLRSAAKS